MYVFFFFFFTTAFSFLALNYLGLYGVFFLNLIPLFLSWISLLLYFNLIFKYNIFYYINAGSWIYLTNFYKNSFEFLIDSTAYSFILLTTSIAVFVYIFTFSYFRYEPLVERLLLFLNSFILSMVFLVSSGNLIMFFLGWELIGLTSFFLINFWSTKVATLKCAFKAYSFNKFSDCLLLFSFILIFLLFQTSDLLTIISTSYVYTSYEVDILVFSLSYIEAISFLLMGAAFIKSAQFGAHIWLPDSMEAPVPASALIHSATLVSAGIFILLRFSVFFENSYLLLNIILLVGSFTAFYGGIVAAFQTDCKKLLAYSTISHCGFLMVIYTTMCFEYTVLYLYVHGFFKASTFLSVGNILRFGRLQDYRRMGNFSKYLPFDSYATLVGLINLAGLPFTFGFFIKHLLFVSLNINIYIYYIAMCFSVVGALSGIIYSYRLYYYVFFDYKKGRKATYLHVTSPLYKSIFYTNSGVASSLAIFFLIVVAYIISTNLLIIYLNNATFFSDFLSYKNYNTQLEYAIELIQTTKNYQILNTFVILLVFSVLYTPWRSQLYNFFLFYRFFSLLLLSFFFLLFFFILDYNNIFLIFTTISTFLNSFKQFFSFISSFLNLFVSNILNITFFKGVSLGNIFYFLLIVYIPYILKFLIIFIFSYKYLSLKNFLCRFFMVSYIITLLLIVFSFNWVSILYYYTTFLDFLITFTLIFFILTISFKDFLHSFISLFEYSKSSIINNFKYLVLKIYNWLLNL